MAPITKAGTPHSQSYVVCLDCGKQFEYDLKEMRMGKAIERGHDNAVVPPAEGAGKRKALYAIAAAIPAAVLLRAAWKSGPNKPKEPEKPE